MPTHAKSRESLYTMKGPDDSLNTKYCSEVQKADLLFLNLFYCAVYCFFFGTPFHSLWYVDMNIGILMTVTFHDLNIVYIQNIHCVIFHFWLPSLFTYTISTLKHERKIATRQESFFFLWGRVSYSGRASQLRQRQTNNPRFDQPERKAYLQARGWTTQNWDLHWIRLGKMPRKEIATDIEVLTGCKTVWIILQCFQHTLRCTVLKKTVYLKFALYSFKSGVLVISFQITTWR